MHGLVLGPASVLVPVAQMSFVITALLGVAMFRERARFEKMRGPCESPRGADLICRELVRVSWLRAHLLTSASEISKLA